MGDGWQCYDNVLFHYICVSCNYINTDLVSIENCLYQLFFSHVYIKGIHFYNYLMGGIHESNKAIIRVFSIPLLFLFLGIVDNLRSNNTNIINVYKIVS